MKKRAEPERKTMYIRKSKTEGERTEKEVGEMEQRAEMVMKGCEEAKAAEARAIMRGLSWKFKKLLSNSKSVIFTRDEMNTRRWRG